MQWKIKHIFNFGNDNYWQKGYTQFGFHDYKGSNYVLQNEKHWLGQLTRRNDFIWTAGSINPNLSDKHLFFDLKNPVYVSLSYIDESLIVSSSGNKMIYKLFPNDDKVELLIDANKFGLIDIGNCVCDKKGNIWINEITGCRIWQFDNNGKKKAVIGDGKPGFQMKSTSLATAKFNWIYDIRLGPDDNLYVLDSRNYALRMLNYNEQTVNLVVGTGKPGYSGDGGRATEATLGSNSNEKFDGPWSLSLDEDGNIFIGDTQNHVIRMVEKKNGIISTIAGNFNSIQSKRNSPKETNALKLNFPKICSMDYFNGELFIPEWDGDLVVLIKSTK
ncbi:MAG: hypothetical protein JXA54_12925 [Candidatus Heimdallarchaeota archaeon]|nr:hypothetical protein [Candidatus Heimdallarchaeota archaeon]